MMILNMHLPKIVIFPEVLQVYPNLISWTFTNAISF